MVKAADIGSLIILTPGVRGGESADFRNRCHRPADRRVVQVRL
jgi:hypothetical protein